MAQRAKTKRRSPRKSKTATKRVKPIPTGYHSATPYLTVTNGVEALDFYKRAFGAREDVPPKKLAERAKAAMAQMGAERK